MSPSIVLAVVFAAAGLAIAGGEALNVWFGHASATWPTTPGRVAGPGAVDVGTLASRRDAAAAVTYVYEVGGRAYAARRIDYGGGASGDAAAVGRALARYPDSAPVTVRYDPRCPARAVLEAGVTGGTYLRLVAGLTALATGGLLAGSTVA